MKSTRCNDKHKSSALNFTSGRNFTSAHDPNTYTVQASENNVNARATTCQLILTLEDSSLIQWLSPLDSCKKKTSAIMILCESSVASQVTVVT